VRPACRLHQLFGGFQQSEIRTITAELDPFNHAWIFDGYFFDQINGSDTERRFDRISNPLLGGGRTAVLLADYDIDQAN